MVTSVGDSPTFPNKSFCVVFRWRNECVSFPEDH
jgi:hypothetical protein